MTTAVRPVQLFCLPHAGAAAASYTDWSGRLGPCVDVVPVDLPGHGQRIGEPQRETMSAVVADLMATLDERFRRGPFAFFGHSLGAYVAVALATECVRRAGPLPLGLVLSAALPPGRGDDQTQVVDSLARLADDELVDLLVNLDDSGRLDAATRRSLTTFLLPLIRTDLQLASAWTARAELSTLSLPALLLSGREDPLAPPMKMAAWAAHFESPVTSRSYPGGHFYLMRRADKVLDDVQNAVIAFNRTGGRHSAAPSVAYRTVDAIEAERSE